MLGMHCKLPVLAQHCHVDQSRVTLNGFCHAAAVFWVGLRRGWWISIISHILKVINSKGSPQKKKKKKKVQQEKKRKNKAAAAMDEAEDSSVNESPEAADEGGAAAAKALFTSMKAKMMGSKTRSGGDAAERKFSLLLFQ